MTLNPPKAVRAVLYILTAVGTPLVAYLNAKGIIGSLEVSFWSAEVAVATGLAAINTNARNEASVAVNAPADVDVMLEQRDDLARGLGERVRKADERGATDLVTALVVVFLIVAVLVLLGVLR